MDSSKVVLVLSLIWILHQASVCVAQDTTTDVTDVAEVTSPVSDFYEVNDTDQDSRNDTQEIRICDWDVSGTRKLRVSWFGNASDDSEVVVDAQAVDTTGCNFPILSGTKKFSKSFIDLPVCSNTQYVISIQLKCSAPETSRTVWSPPEPPKNLLIENVGNTSFAVTWSKPPGSGEIEVYSVSVIDDSGFRILRNSTLEKLLISGLTPWTIYRVSVAAKNRDLWGEYSNETQVKTTSGIPPAPRNLKQTTVSNTSVSLKWDHPSVSKGPILKYTVRWKNSNAFSEENTASNETEYVIKSLVSFTQYTFSVAAVTEAGEGNWSEEISVRTRVGIPAAPRNLQQTTVGNTSVSLRWDHPSVSTGPIFKYAVLRQNSSASSIEYTASNETDHVVKSLVPFTQYIFSVAAVTEAGQGNWSKEISVLTKVGIPPAPRNLQQTTVSNTSVGLRWDHPSVLTGPILKYAVLRQNSSASSVEYTASNETDHVIKSLLPFTQYTFSVAAVTEAGQGNWSEEISVLTKVGIPHAPKNLKEISVTNTSVTLRWEEPLTSTGPVLNYRVWWQNSTIPIEEVTQSNSTVYTVKGLWPYANYTFKVLAVTEAGPGAWSEEIDVQTKVGIPYAPRNVEVASVTSTSIVLKWDSPEIHTGPILKYHVLWKNKTDEDGKDVPPNELSYTVSSLMPYVEYTFQILAVSEAGPGPLSKELTVRTAVGIPHAPRNLKAISVTNTSITLDWTAPNVSTGPILTYIVHWQNSSSKGWRYTLTNATSYKMEDLTPFVPYTFSVLAGTIAGEGEMSEEVHVQTDIGVPLAPTKLLMMKVSNTSVDIQWKEPNISRGPILRYRVHGENSSMSWEEDTISNGTSYKLAHLTPYINYTVKVLGLTSAGPGHWSEEIKLQTKVGIPHAPRDLTMIKITNTTAELKWSVPSISTGPIIDYRVRWKNSSGEGELNTGSTDLFHTLRYLTPYVDYTFEVLALTAAGPGKWSNQVKYRTKVGVPHAVEKFVATHTSNTSIDVEWDAPLVSTGPILQYKIRWESVNGSGEEYTKSDKTHYTLLRLTPYFYYKLKCLALTEAGPGPWSKELKVRTQIGVPHPPTELAASNVTNSSVLITWMYPVPSTGPIEFYTVRWNSARGSGSNDTKERSYLVTKLLPYVNYTFQVSASTLAGRGEWSKSYLVLTDIGVPSAPRKLQSRRAANTSLTMTWNRPVYPNAPMLDYILTYRLLLRDDVDPFIVTIQAPAEQESVTYVIRDLLPYSYYTIRVYASSPVGIGPASDDVINQTKIGVPLPAKILQVRAAKQRMAIVRWATEEPYPGPVDYSLETWKFPRLCSGSDKEHVVKVMKGSHRAEEWRREHDTKIENLTPFGVYRFKILLKTAATDVFINSTVSDTIRIPPEASSKPLYIKAECTGSPTELKISWRPPGEPNGLIISYRIQYGIETFSSSDLVHVNNMCQSQSYVLKGLRPERRYLISVSARVENVSEDGVPAQARNVCMLPPGIPFLGDTSGVQAEGSGSESVELVWTKDTFSDYMGAIVQYAVLVGSLNSLGNATSGKWAELAPTWFNFSSGSSDFYQVTPPGWNPFQDVFDPLDCRISYEVQNEVNRTVLRCTIGLDKNCPKNESYCNGPLKPDTQYEMKIRAFTRGGFAETDPIRARSRPVPKPSVAGKVVAVVFVLFFLVALAGGGYVMKKKGYLDTVIVLVQSRFNPKEEPPKREEPPIQMEECTSPKPIKTKNFFEHVRIMMSDSHLKFSLEFEKLKNESPRLPCTVAEMEENRSKNRWMNIFPFDHSRVKLLPLCDEPGSDFINANYIPGYSSRREYIATQGPLPQVLDDFWRMIWEQSVNVIVMLTQCVERGKKKCEKYWPDSGDTAYHGDLRITTVSVSMLSSYIIRIFHVQLGSYERLVKQMHFTHWPDFGCPESPEDLINFVNAVREHLPRVAPGPILVHCSAGVGRTGTFITVDRLMLQLRNARYPGEDTVDVYGTVLELRQHRTNMVQTEDQYIYIHLCVRQLIEDRDRPRETGSQENIYSNLAIERDSPRDFKPTAPELPL